MLTEEARKAFTFKRLRLLFFRPMVILVISLAFWRLVVVERFRHWLSYLDTEAIAMSVGASVLYHAVVATWAFGYALSGRQRMHDCINVEPRNLVAFVQLRDDRIFWPVHPLLLCFSILTQFGTMIVDYQSMVSGYFAMTTATIIVTLYWEVGMVADDPVNSRWYDDDERIPKEYRSKEFTKDDAREIMDRERSLAESSLAYAIARRLRYESEDFKLMSDFCRRHPNFKP